MTFRRTEIIKWTAAQLGVASSILTITAFLDNFLHCKNQKLKACIFSLLCQDHKGAIRMKGLERTADGRCRIGSQFMIWVGDLEYKVR